MSEATDLDQVGRSVLDDATSPCHIHPGDTLDGVIAGTLAARQWCYCEERGRGPCGSYCDTAGAALFRLTDGQYAVATESSDTSGHG